MVRVGHGAGATSDDGKQWLAWAVPAPSDRMRTYLATALTAMLLATGCTTDPQPVVVDVSGSSEVDSDADVADNADGDAEHGDVRTSSASLAPAQLDLPGEHVLADGERIVTITASHDADELTITSADGTVWQSDTDELFGLTYYIHPDQLAREEAIEVGGGNDDIYEALAVPGPVTVSADSGAHAAVLIDVLAVNDEVAVTIAYQGDGTVTLTLAHPHGPIEGNVQLADGTVDSFAISGDTTATVDLHLPAHQRVEVAIDLTSPHDRRLTPEVAVYQPAYELGADIVDVRPTDDTHVDAVEIVVALTGLPDGVVPELARIDHTGPDGQPNSRVGRVDVDAGGTVAVVFHWVIDELDRDAGGQVTFDRLVVASYSHGLEQTLEGPLVATVLSR
jgi:hypothetical protein